MWGEEPYDDRQQRRNGRNRMLLTLVIRLPRPDDCTRNGRDAQCGHTIPSIRVLYIPFRRDRLSEQDCGRHDA